jgi:hypothetical protein
MLTYIALGGTHQLEISPGGKAEKKSQILRVLVNTGELHQGFRAPRSLNFKHHRDVPGLPLKFRKSQSRLSFQGSPWTLKRVKDSKNKGNSLQDNKGEETLHRRPRPQRTPKSNRALRWQPKGTRAR